MNSRQEVWLAIPIIVALQLPSADGQIHDHRLAGDRVILRIKDISVPFRWCPEGVFSMGSPVSEPHRQENENQVEVVLTHGFWMQETEVTQELWVAVMGKNPSAFCSTGERKNKVKGVDTKRFPVEQVLWDEAIEFIERLNALAQKGSRNESAPFRLPTEAEWEYACRAGTTTAYHFGNSDKQFDEFDVRINFDRRRTGPFEVGKRKPNPWGLHDVHGNVSEWCYDWYAEKLEGGFNPTGPDKGKWHVIRGGGWGGSPEIGNNRSANRGMPLPTVRSDSFGLRILRQASRF